MLRQTFLCLFLLQSAVKMLPLCTHKYGKTMKIKSPFSITYLGKYSLFFLSRVNSEIYSCKLIQYSAPVIRGHSFCLILQFISGNHVSPDISIRLVMLILPFHVICMHIGKILCNSALSHCIVTVIKFGITVFLY